MDITFPAVGKGKLAKPTDLAVKADSKTKTGFTITWTAVPNVAGYTAQAVAGSTTVNGVVSGTNTEAVFTGLATNTAYKVTVTATGNANYADSDASDEFDASTAANQAPVIETIGSQTATVGTDLEVDVDATDANAEDTLEYKASSDDTAIATVSPAELADLGANSKVTVTPVAAGTATITVTVSDGTASVSDTFNIVVSTAAAMPIFSVSGPATVAEDAGTATYAVSLSAEPGSDVTVDYATSDGTATAGSDYTATSGTLTFTTTSWDTAQTVAVTIANDSVDESNETFTVTLSDAGSGSVLSTTSASVETTITDDDTRGVTLSESSLTVLEGATGTYTVVLDSEPTGNVTVTVGGTESTDVTVDTSPETGNQTTLTFTSTTWNTAQAVTVTAATDADTASDPVVTLTHAVTGAGYGSVTAGSVAVTITDGRTRRRRRSPKGGRRGWRTSVTRRRSWRSVG